LLSALSSPSIYDPTYPLKTKQKVDHNAATIAEIRKQHEPYIQGMDDHIRELNARLHKQVLFIVPVGQAVIALREKIITSSATTGVILRRRCRRWRPGAILP